MLLILDTSVLISVLVSRGKSYARDILRLASNNKVTLITSSDAFTELRTTLKSDKIKKLINYNPAKIGSFVAWYKYNAQFVTIPPEKTSSISSRDMKDNIYVLLAEESKADFLITIDNDLLILKEIKTTQITTPENFIKIFTPL